MQSEAFDRQYLQHFTKQQVAAVREIEGPVLLLAVPGSGKTTVLVTRLGYMTHVCGVDPGRILTITYTVSAAQDMKTRYRSLFQDETADILEFRTINGICAKIIQQYGRLIGKQPFALLDSEKERLLLIGDLYRKLTGNYGAESDIKSVSTWITYIKNRMLTDKEIAALDNEVQFPLSDLYKQYNALLRGRGLMDYDDQMVYALTILKKTPKLLDAYRAQFPYICVDEAQDTSKIQHTIIALLAGKSGNLFMVGDEDQSIYGFRAAYPEALLHFEEQHPGAKVLLMEQNFRSGGAIVEAANQLIGCNTKRHVKHMMTTKDRGHEIHIVDVKSRGAQYGYLCKVAISLQQPANIKQTAVLFRNNESAIPLIDRLERENIPYRFRGADLSFFTHRVVRDIKSIMQFAMHPGDPALFMDVYYKISSYISKRDAAHAAETVAELKRQAEANGRSVTHLNVLDVVLRNPMIPQGTVKSVKSMRTHLLHMCSESPWDALVRISGPMGYGEYLERSGISDGRLRILYALAAKETTMVSFLHRLDELQNAIMNHKNDPDCPFILSTIHSSKGLEYDSVYLLDVEDGVFPEVMPEDPKHLQKDEIDAFEEERRIFYVGVTRAKQDLYLFRVGRGIHASTFVTELLKRPKKSMDGYRKFYDDLCEGIAVVHVRYGEGVIIEIDGDRAEILFGDTTKKMNLKVVFENDLLRLE